MPAAELSLREFSYFSLQVLDRKKICEQTHTTIRSLVTDSISTGRDLNPGVLL